MLCCVLIALMTGFPRSDEAKQPDDDPRDFHGHGTHVAGIIAGETEKSDHYFLVAGEAQADDKDSWVGVAPEATLFAYKVFGAGVRCLVFCVP